MATATLIGRRGPDLLLRGSTLFYLGLAVVLPLAALTVEAVRPGAVAVLGGDSRSLRLACLKLTLVTAVVMVLVNALTGTATAWVLVRYEFPGRAW